MPLPRPNRPVPAQARSRRPAGTAPAPASAARPLAGHAAVAVAALVLAVCGPATAQVQTSRAAAAAAAAAAHPSQAFWTDVRGTPAALSARGTEPTVTLQRFRGLALDRSGLSAVLAAAPAEFSAAARSRPMIVSLPHPGGGWQRFELVDSPVMEPGLAARHPNIRTYSGRGIDDPTATLRMSVSQIGLQASVRAQGGSWHIDPYYHLDESLYASYFRRDAVNTRAPFAESMVEQAVVSLSRGRYRAADSVRLDGSGFTPGATVQITVRPAADPAAATTVTATADADGRIASAFTAAAWRTTGAYEILVSDGRRTAFSHYTVVADSEPVLQNNGQLLRTHRLALLTDPAYANYWGEANVTAAKVALMNRVNQVYEQDLSIRMVLIAGNDVLNLNTAAQMTGTNGPCGATACYTTTQAASCSSSTLTRTRQVIGLLVGASAFDVGHIALGSDGGGIASLGVVGLNNKAQGCTGINPPAGDIFAIDYVAHELGHQYAGNHTFNGTLGNCSGGNRAAIASVEPGSGTSVMAYAGICGNDNTQLNSDPYFSMRSFDEIIAHVTAAETNINEVQQAALTGFTTNGQQFVLRYNGADSAPVVRGTNFTTAGVKAAVEGIAGWPAGGTVTVSALTDGGFTVTFGGTLANTNVPNLELRDCTAPCTGFVGEIAKGGLTTRGGTVTATNNTPPVVTTSAAFTIPVRTPFALTGSAVDAEGDTVTYMWEQTDRGGSAGTSLVNNTKVDGPLFRQFGTRAVFDASQIAPPGQNQLTTNPTRVFPDLLQVLANNTNAETGGCGTISGAPTPEQIDCFSEFLPTASYTGFAGVNASPARLNFRLTARDGRGGSGFGTTVLTLAPGAGPFLVTAPNSAVTWYAGVPRTVTWAVANTNQAPVNTANVRITMSADGGSTWPHVLASSVPNNGSASVTLPDVATAQARVRVEAVGNVFFDVSNTSFTVRRQGDANGDGSITCADVALVRAAFGRTTGQAGYEALLDINSDGVINIRDLALVTSRLAAGTSCP